MLLSLNIYYAVALSHPALNYQQHKKLSSTKLLVIAKSQSISYFQQFGQLSFLQSRLIECFLVSSSRRFFAGSEAITCPVLDRCLLIYDSQGEFFVLFAYLFLLSKTSLMHGKHVAVFLDFGLTFLGIDDLIKKDLIFRVDLKEIFL